jgi:hypothetical protein
VPHSAPKLYRSCALLAVFAFLATLLMTSGFGDQYARMLFSAAVASWVAVNSGITGFVLMKMEEEA